MAFSKDSGNDDISGLHDLQSMASSAKKRRSQRLSSQMDAQESLLRSTAALDAVVLPDPDKEQVVTVAELVDSPVAAVESASISSFSTASIASSGGSVADLEPMVEAPKRPSSSLFIAFAVIALVAAVGGAGWMFLGSGESGEQPAALATASPTVEPSADTESKVTTSLGGAPNPGTDDSAKPTSLSVVANKVDTKEASGQPNPAASVDANKKPPRSEKNAVVHHAVAKSKALGKQGRNKLGKAGKKTVSSEKAATPEVKSKVAKKASKSESLNDALAMAVGGIDEPVATIAVVKKPSKVQLGRGDVSRAMKKISRAAKSCYKAENFSGMVTIKYSVGQDGSVTKAAAGGAHASSKTGKCLVKAVKKAKFPPFSGAPMSFSFPFLLSP